MGRIDGEQSGAPPVMRIAAPREPAPLPVSTGLKPIPTAASGTWLTRRAARLKARALELERSIHGVGASRRRIRTLEPTRHRIYGVRVTEAGLLFEQPLAGVSQMYLAGDFNDWSPHATVMTADPGRGTWRVCINLPPGRYRYRLVADGRWMRDPYNMYVEANPYGEYNSVVVFTAGC